MITHRAAHFLPTAADTCICSAPSMRIVCGATREGISAFVRTWQRKCKETQCLCGTTRKGISVFVAERQRKCKER